MSANKQLTDIKNELSHYKNHFKNIFAPCNEYHQYNRTC